MFIVAFNIGFSGQFLTIFVGFSVFTEAVLANEPYAITPMYKL